MACNVTKTYFDDDGEEYGKPGFGPQVVENEADQGVRWLKEKQKLINHFTFI
jgi:hypothetical protein